MEGTVASEKKLVGTISSGSTMTGGMATVLAKDGKDGFSPTIELHEIYNGFGIKVTDVNGVNSCEIYNGYDGLSAYDVAVNNGFDGTEEEWLASLQGKDGFSPIIDPTDNGYGYDIYIEGINLSGSWDSWNISIHNGKDGKDGEDGKDGVDGTVAFEELTEEQRESLRGEPGESYVLTDADKREIADMIEGSDATIPEEVTEHITRTDNPHKVTAEQVGAVPVGTYETFCLDTNILLGAHEELISDNRIDINTHIEDKNNPHGVTCEQIRAATVDDIDRVEQIATDALNTIAQAPTVEYLNDEVERIEQLIADNKAVIVTVSGSTPSHTSQQIYALIQEGKAVYLQLWGNTFTICTGCTASEAKFENSYVSSITGADGKTYSAQAFRLFLIKNGTYAATSTTIPAQTYVDAQVTTALANASIAYVGSATPTNDMGKDGDIYIVSG